MQAINRRTALAVGLAAAAWPASAQEAPPSPADVSARTGGFTCTQLPKLTLSLDPKLEYLGAFKFDIRGIAGGYRYLWGEVGAARRLKRVFIVQREGYYSGPGRYRYPANNPVTLGGEVYGHSVNFYSNDPVAAELPHNEAYGTQQFFLGKGLRWESETIMSRFARIVDQGGQNEIIFFYFENLADLTSAPFEQISARDAADPERIALKAGVDERSRKAVQVAG